MSQPEDVTEQLPSEILLHILCLATADEGVRVDAYTERPLKVQKSSLYAISAVCQQWRALNENVPAWQRIVIDVSNSHGPAPQQPVQWREEYGALLRQVLEMRKRTGQALEVKCNIADQWPDDERDILESPALTRLVQADIAWKAFEYVASPFSSMDWVCETLEFVRSKFGDWEYLGIDLEDGPFVEEYWSVKDLVGKMTDMPKLQRLALKLGWKGRWHWHSWSIWPSFPSLPVRELKLQASEAVCVVMMKMCPQVSSVDICVDGKEEDTLEKEEKAPDNGLDFAMMNLKTLGLIVMAGNADFVQILTRMECPRLERFVFEWPSNTEAVAKQNGVGALECFVERPRNLALTGEVYLPYVRVKGIENWGLKRLTTAPRDYYSSRRGRPSFL
ncbi:hypothetical protein AAF712_006030 [Marasmius tenuissimus]|uniref:F-box domain-containing protein n=1 Tax=Marasmius tenuissimus TaxID=585030 RepID=A0ABR2ZZR7_9AGAR